MTTGAPMPSSVPSFHLLRRMEASVACSGTSFASDGGLPMTAKGYNKGYKGYNVRYLV